MPRKRIPRDFARARTLRARMTLPEVLLWRHLKGEPDGVRFRRQYQVDRYYIDFYCAKAKVGIEVDGIVHAMGENPQRDAERETVIRSHGIELIRIPASEVLHSPEAVTTRIVHYCKR